MMKRLFDRCLAVCPYSRLVSQFVVYGFFGVLSTLASFITFFAFAAWVFPCLHVGEVPFLPGVEISDSARSVRAMLSNCPAFLAGNTVAYVTNVRYVFKGGRHHPLLEILLFFGSALLALFIGNALMGVLIGSFGWLTSWAFLTNIFVSLAINFLFRKLVVFHG